MGIADYGVNGKTVYHYTSAEFASWANFTSLEIGNGGGAMTIQQNLVDYGVAQGNVIGFYWAQNVPRITQLSQNLFQVKFIDNIWNLSYFMAGLTGVFGNLQDRCNRFGG